MAFKTNTAVKQSKNKIHRTLFKEDLGVRETGIQMSASPLVSCTLMQVIYSSISLPYLWKEQFHLPQQGMNHGGKCEYSTALTTSHSINEGSYCSNPDHYLSKCNLGISIISTCSNAHQWISWTQASSHGECQQPVILTVEHAQMWGPGFNPQRTRTYTHIPCSEADASGSHL
jgi:hypothetical protein